MAALSVIGATLNRQDLVPLSSNTGASSPSDPNAGSNAPYDPTTETGPVTTADKAGAAILTAIVIILVIGGAVFLII